MLEPFRYYSKVQLLENSLKYVCNLCSRFSTNHPEEILKHFSELHNTIRMINCVYCCQNVRIPQYLSHVDQHLSFTGHSQFYCEICDASIDLTKAAAIMDHVSNFHNHNNQCPVCLTEFSGKASLYYHIKGSLETLYHCGNKRCWVMSHDKDHFLQHFNNNPTCIKYLVVEEMITSCLNRKYNETCCMVKDRDDRIEEKPLRSKAILQLFNEISVSENVIDLTFSRENSLESQNNFNEITKNEMTLTPIQSSTPVTNSKSYKRERHSDPVIMDYFSLENSKISNTPRVGLRRIKKDKVVLSSKNRYNSVTSSAASKKNLQVKIKNSLKPSLKSELDISKAHQVNNTFELKVSKRILTKLLPNISKEEFLKLSQNLETYETCTFSVEIIEKKKWFVCTECRYKTEHSSSDIRKHILSIHCGVSSIYYLPCLQANRLNWDCSLCSEKKMIECINKHRKRRSIETKSYFELISDSENDQNDVRSEAKQKHRLSFDETFNTTSKRLKLDEIKLNYSEVVLRLICQKQNQDEIFEDLNEKMKIYASIKGTCTIENSKRVLSCSACIQRFKKVNNFCFHVMSIHAYISFKQIKLARSCSKMDKSYGLLNDDDMINFFQNK